MIYVAILFLIILFIIIIKQYLFVEKFSERVLEESYDTFNHQDILTKLIENDFTIYKKKVVTGTPGMGAGKTTYSLEFKKEDLESNGLNELININSLIPINYKIARQNTDEINKLRESINSMKESIYNLEKK